MGQKPYKIINKTTEEILIIEIESMNRLAEQILTINFDCEYRKLQWVFLKRKRNQMTRPNKFLEGKIHVFQLQFSRFLTIVL